MHVFRHILLPATMAAAIPALLAAATPANGTFSPPVFFLGHTEGRGSLSKVLSRTSSITVQGTGHMEGAGTFILDQTIEILGLKTKHREWRPVETTPGHFRGSLSDATSQVAGTVIGNDFHVRYRTKGAVSVDQHLVLQPSGQSIHNRMVFRKFGIVVARMNEIIRRAQ